MWFTNPVGITRTILPDGRKIVIRREFPGSKSDRYEIIVGGNSTFFPHTYATLDEATEAFEKWAMHRNLIASGSPGSAGSAGQGS